MTLQDFGARARGGFKKYGGELGKKWPKNTSGICICICMQLSYLFVDICGQKWNCPDMPKKREKAEALSLETLRIMAGMEDRINRLIEKETTHCGESGGVVDAMHYQRKIMEWLAGELEKLGRKAGGK